MSGFDYDIVIAGGGLVGASLAVALRGSGYRVAVVEPVPPQAESQPSFDDRQTALAPTSRRFFENLGLWEAIEAGAGYDAVFLALAGGPAPVVLAYAGLEYVGRVPGGAAGTEPAV